MLKGSGIGNYINPINLRFSHALAKVRVLLVGDMESEVTDVMIKSYTSCTNTQGTVSTDGASKGWITMKKCEYNGRTFWEANVVPGEVIMEFQVNEIQSELSGYGIIPLTNKVNIITLSVY